MEAKSIGEPKFAVGDMIETFQHGKKPKCGEC